MRCLVTLILLFFIIGNDKLQWFYIFGWKDIPDEGTYSCACIFFTVFVNIRYLGNEFEIY